MMLKQFCQRYEQSRTNHYILWSRITKDLTPQVKRYKIAQDKTVEAK